MHKSVKEAAKLSKLHAAKRKLATERRAAQALNVAAKKEAKKAATTPILDVDGNAVAEEEDEEEDEDKIDSDNSFDYDEQHGLEEFSDEEELDLGSEGDDESDYDSEGIQSDADDSDKEEDDMVFSTQDLSTEKPTGKRAKQSAADDEAEGEAYAVVKGDKQPIWNGEADDSDLSPFAYNSNESEDAASEEEDQDDGIERTAEGSTKFVKLLPKLKKGGANKPSAGNSSMGFKHKSFVKQERAPAKGAIGIHTVAPPKKLTADQEASAEVAATSARGGRGGRGADRGTRGGARGRGAGAERGRGAPSYERGRKGSRGSSRGGERGGFAKRGESSRGGGRGGGRGGRGGGRGRD